MVDYQVLVFYRFERLRSKAVFLEHVDEIHVSLYGFHERIVSVKLSSIKKQISIIEIACKNRIIHHIF